MNKILKRALIAMMLTIGNHASAMDLSPITKLSGSVVQSFGRMPLWHKIAATVAVCGITRGIMGLYAFWNEQRPDDSRFDKEDSEVNRESFAHGEVSRLCVQMMEESKEVDPFFLVDRATQQGYLAPSDSDGDRSDTVTEIPASPTSRVRREEGLANHKALWADVVAQINGSKDLKPEFEIRNN